MFVDLPWKISNDVLCDFFDVIPLNISFLFCLKIVISLLSLKKYKVLLDTRGVRYNRVFMLLLSVTNNNQSNTYRRVDETFKSTAHKSDVVSPYAVLDEWLVQNFSLVYAKSFSCLMLRSALLPYCFPNRSEIRNYLVFGEPSIALLLEKAAILVKNLETDLCVFPSAMLISVLQWSQCFKIREAQHWRGRGRIKVRTKVWGVNLDREFFTKFKRNDVCFNDLWRVL